MKLNKVCSILNQKEVNMDINKSDGIYNYLKSSDLLPSHTFLLIASETGTTKKEVAQLPRREWTEPA